MKKSEISQCERHLIIFLYKEGLTQRSIAAKVQKGQSTVGYIIKKFKETGCISNRKRSGRPRKTSKRDDAVLRRLSLKNRCWTSPELKREWQQSTGVNVCASLIRYRLLGMGLRGCRAAKKPLVTEHQRKIRPRWA
jgi:transposase